MIRMGVINTSKDQALLVSESSKEQEKGKSKKKEPKLADSNPKQNQQTSEGASESKKKKKKCPYCMRGFHPEDSCMKKNLDQMKYLCVHNNIFLTQRAVMSYDVEQTKEYEI